MRSRLLVREVWTLPVIVDRLDNETQRRADAVHIFIHDLLDNRRLTGVVEAAA